MEGASPPGPPTAADDLATHPMPPPSLTAPPGASPMPPPSLTDDADAGASLAFAPAAAPAPQVHAGPSGVPWMDLRSDLDEEAGSVMGGTRKTMTRQDHEAAIEAGRVTYAESGDSAEETDDDDDGCGSCG